MWGEGSLIEHKPFNVSDLIEYHSKKRLSGIRRDCVIADGRFFVILGIILSVLSGHTLYLIESAF